MSEETKTTAEPQNDLQAIYAELLAGDETARERLIIAAMPLVRHEVNNFTQRNYDSRPFKQELLSAGYLAVCDAVSRIACRGAIDNITAMLRTCIKRECRDEFDNSCLIGPGRTVVREGRSKGREPPPAVCELLRSYAVRVESSSVSESDIAELCETDAERQVVELRAQSMTDAEVAEQLGTNPVAVRRHRKAVEARYDAACLALGA